MKVRHIKTIRYAKHKKWQAYKNKFQLDIVFDSFINEYVALLPKKMTRSLGWKVGDNLQWINLDDNTFKLIKINEK